MMTRRKLFALLAAALVPVEVASLNASLNATLERVLASYGGIEGWLRSLPQEKFLELATERLVKQ